MSFLRLNGALVTLNGAALALGAVVVSGRLSMADIAEILFARLEASNLGPVAWPGVRFDPPNEGYLSVSLFPLPATAATVSSHDRIDGLMQVSVFWPVDKGIMAPMARAQAVADRFRRNTALQQNGRDVQIVRPAYIAAPIQEAGWLQIPVTIPWTAFVRT